MRVLCIEGYSGVLEEGEVYTVREITETGNYILWEVQPPQPYSSFKRKRFANLEDEPAEEFLLEEEMGATRIDG